MQATFRLVRSRPIRLRFVRKIVRWFRARLREESPVIDHVAPRATLRPPV